MFSRAIQLTVTEAGSDPSVPRLYASPTLWASVSPFVQWEDPDSTRVSQLCAPLGEGYQSYHIRGWSNGGTFTQPSLLANSCALRLASSQT